MDAQVSRDAGSRKRLTRRPPSTVPHSAKQAGHARALFFELGQRKVVGGQEDLILEVADQLARRAKGTGKNPPAS